MNNRNYNRIESASNTVIISINACLCTFIVILVVFSTIYSDFMHYYE